MEFDGAIEEAGASAAGAVFAGGIAGGFDHARVLGEAEVVVRANHDFALAVANHIVAVGLLDGAEIGIEALSSRVGAIPVFTTLLKKVSRSV